MSATFNFQEDFQELLLASMVRRPGDFAFVGPAVKPSYFTGVQATVVAKCIVAYSAKYSRYPGFNALKQVVADEVSRMPDADARMAIDFVDKISITPTEDWEFARENVVRFVRERAVIDAARKTITMLQEGKLPADGFAGLFQEAMQVGQNLDDLGLLFHSDADKVIAQVTDVEYGVATGYAQWDKLWKKGWAPGWLIALLAPPKRYKCLGKGTPVLMFDGTIRAIEDVKVGDSVMGDDYTARIVLTSGDGHGEMYTVFQETGRDYVCNDVHILCLCTEDGAQTEIEAQQFAALPERERRRWLGFRNLANGGRATSNISVRHRGWGQYFGITISGNERFLLGDRTVTHNTGLAVNLAMNVVSPSVGEDVLYYACEINQELAMLRALCHLSGLSPDYLYENPDKFKATVAAKMQHKVAGNLLFKGFPAKSATINDIRAHAKTAINQLGIKPRMIVIDYAETIAPIDKSAPEYRQQSSIYTDARALGKELGCCVVLPDRCNKETVEMPVPDMKGFQGAFEKAGIVDVAIGLCIHHDQGVITNKGSIKVSQLRHELQVCTEPILALSHNFSTGKNEWKPILNWFNNGKATTPFVRVKTDALAPGMALRRNEGAIVTPEHAFFNPRGAKVLAKDLAAGDSISTLMYNLSEDQRQVLIGTMMGDGHIARYPDVRLVLSHGEQQAYYAKWKYSVFSTLSASLKTYVTKAKIYGGVSLPTRTKWTVYAGGSREIAEMRDIFYPNGVKVVPRNLLRHISTLGLAVWFMDDGSIDKQDRILLHTQSFTREECLFLADWFKHRWGLDCRPDAKNILRFGAVSTRKLLKLLSPYLVRNTEHDPRFKRQESKRFLCPVTEQGVLSQGAATVLSVVPFALQKKPRLRNKYDIEVADNHNYYLCSGVLVSNCATSEEHRNNVLRTFVFLNRHGPAMAHHRGKVDPETWRIELCEEVPYEPESTGSRPTGKGRGGKSSHPSYDEGGDERPASRR